MIPPFATEIHHYSAFETSPKCYLLYFLLRSTDTQGSGEVTFDIKDLTKAVDRTRPTVNQWIRDCCQYGLFRYCRWITRSKVTVYYTNLTDVALSQGIDNIGESTWVPLEVFRNSLHVWTSEVKAMSLQHQSFYRMYEEQSKKQQRTKPRVNTHADIFNRKPQDLNTFDFFKALSKDKSERTYTDPVFLGDRCAFVSPSFTTWGGSQTTIASRLDKTTRTVQRHFSAAYRESKGLPDLEKYQLAIAVGTSTSKRTLSKSKQVNDADFNFINRLFTVGRGEHRIEFIAGNNLYNSSVNYRYCDRLGSKIKSRAMKIVKNKLSIPKLNPIDPIYYFSPNTPTDKTKNNWPPLEVDYWR